MSDMSRRTGGRVFEFSELVSAYYYPSAIPDNPYVDKNVNFSQIYVVVDGEGYYTLGDKRYSLSSGMMFYCPANTDFSYGWNARRAEYALISFVCDSEALKSFENGPILLGEEEQKIILDTIFTTTHICDYSKIKQPPRIEIVVKPDTPDVVLGYIYASLERFLSIVYCRLMNIDIIINETQKISKKLEETVLISGVKDYLQEHINEQVRIEDICKCFGVSPTVLLEKFKRETNKTVIEYFNEQKIGKAKIMIRSGTASFTEISEALGYSSLNYFSKLFKAKTGMTLTEFSRLASKRETLTRGK
ncbi:MAG: AraC family transcriptional regulator [Clostridia bacterium]|nr:AraC family transcriptional regulator [Clostridia bacterium]